MTDCLCVEGSGTQNFFLLKSLFFLNDYSMKCTGRILRLDYCSPEVLRCHVTLQFDTSVSVIVRLLSSNLIIISLSRWKFDIHFLSIARDSSVGLGLDTLLSDEKSTCTTFTRFSIFTLKTWVSLEIWLVMNFWIYNFFLTLLDFKNFISIFINLFWFHVSWMVFQF